MTDVTDPIRQPDKVQMLIMRAFSTNPVSSDIALLRELSHSKVQRIRNEAYRGLAFVNDSSVVGDVKEVVLSGRTWESVAALQSLRLRCAEHPFLQRTDYLEVIAEALKTLPIDDNVYPDLIETFSYLAGQQLGETGASTFGQVDQRVAQKTARKCIDWLHSLPNR